MTRVDRVVLSCAGVGLVLAVMNGVRGVEAGVATGPTSSTPTRPAREDSAGGSTAQSSLKDDVGRFLAGLDRLRRDDESVMPSLVELSERLCTLHDRCEGRELVAYYSSLSPEERRVGLAEEARFNDLRNEVLEARRSGLSPAQWSVLRASLIDRLRSLVRPIAGEGDCIPGARALSLCALLEVEWLEKDPSLSDERREELLRLARMDAHESTLRFRRAGMLVPQLESRWLLGRLEAAQGRTTPARAVFEDCLALARRVQNEDFAERALLSLVELAQNAGDLSEVERLVTEIAAFRSPATSWPLARAQAELLFERDEADTAVEFLFEHEPEDPIAARDWHLLVAAALLRLGRSDEAREHYDSGSGAPGEFDRSWSAANLELRSGNPTAVIERFGDERVLAALKPSHRMNAEALLGEALVRQGRYEAASEHLARGLELASQIQTRLEQQRAHDDGAVGVLGESVGMHTVALLAEANARIGNSLEAARVIEAYQAHALRYDLATDDTDRSSTDALPSLTDSDLRAWANSFEFGLVTWVVGADATVVAHVAPDGSSTAVPIARGRKAIEEAVRRLREATVVGDETLLLRLLREIRSELLPDRILAKVAAAGTAHRGRLLLLLHGPLEKLPVELLVLTDEIFERRCVTTFLPGLPEPRPGVAAGELSTWTILGGPVDDSGASLLPGSLEEVTAISKMRSGSTLYAGAAFDRDTLRSALGGRNAVHIATHLRPGCGADRGRLANVGLELSRGDSFCAREILELKPTLTLAVLDACETAGGGFVDGEGLQGIARAFLESGTRNLIVTLWPVEDRVARAFAVSFHRELIDGARPSEAAAKAREELRGAGYRPVDWAAFRAIARD